jgi:hypothetical protein
MGVFISHSNRDEEAVRVLIADLERGHQTVWLDQALHGGDTWWQTILKQIRDADVFVFALSNNSQRSKPCRAELDYARALGIPVLPVQIGPLDSPRSAVIADLQIVDYRQRNADAAIRLIAAVQEAKTRRGSLPQPLPDEPPIPFEYLMLLGRTIDAPEMNPSEQVGVIAQLRQGLEDEDDSNARRDITMLLQNMRRRPDATYRSVSEIDALLATIDQAPPTDPETRSFPSLATPPPAQQPRATSEQVSKDASEGKPLPAPRPISVDVSTSPASAGTQLVTLLATDAWKATKAAVASAWRRVHPERAELVEAELVESRAEVVAARAAGDTQGEQALASEWQGRLRRLFAADAEAATELLRALGELAGQLPETERVQIGTIGMSATVTGQGRAYQVGQGSQHITER